MANENIHQAIHGYREGHRLLGSSMPLSADASRLMLVLSDMSGPSMQPGFDEYLTAYPLPNTNFLVFAKTWYAPEMQRPGCVWTHSLFISREQIPMASAVQLLASLRRPQLDEVEGSGSLPLVLADTSFAISEFKGVGRKPIADSLIEAVLGQRRPVVVSVDTANQIESDLLGLWDYLWPSAKVRFSFCTGALSPRSISGVLMDVQAVPRSVPSSQFRKVASSAFVLDLQTPTNSNVWVPEILRGISSGDNALRSWLEAVAGDQDLRGSIASLMPIFEQWQRANLSGKDLIASVVGAPAIETGVRFRLVGMALDRVGSQSGPGGLRELLTYLCSRRDVDLSSMSSLLQDRTRLLFSESRDEGCALVKSLLGAELAELGEGVLRVAVRMLVPDDLKAFGDEEGSFLPTIVGANPTIAVSDDLWKRIGSWAAEVLLQLSTASLGEEDRDRVVDAVLSASSDVPVDAFIRFGGKVAIFRALVLLASGQIQLSWQWRSALSVQPDAVLDWLEGHTSVTAGELDFVTRILNPNTNMYRLTNIWKNSILSGVGIVSPRVAAFGLALALAERNVQSELLEAFFQSTYDALAKSCLDYEEWNWLQNQAPPISWWRDWDRCERLSAAVARLCEQQNAPLKAVFGIVHSRRAIRQVAAFLYDDKAARPYLKSLRKLAESTVSIGTREQRDALLEDW